MKTLRLLITLSLCLILTFNVSMITGQNQFKTQDEAIVKAQENFAALIEGSKWDFGVSATDIKNARAMQPLNYKQVDFNSLLDAENAKSFLDLKSDMINYVVPFELRGEIVAIVQISKSEEGWQIVGTGNPALRTALNMLPAEMIKNGFENLTIYDMQNIIATVYVLELRADEVCFADYADFSLEKGTEPKLLLEYMSKDARMFQEKYGDELKEQKLTN